MKAILAAALLLALTAPAAHARVYNYACNVPDVDSGNKRLHALRIDTAKGILAWQGKTFTRLQAIPGGSEDCAKYCFRAFHANGDIAFVDTATQGYADLTITHKGSIEGDETQCDMVQP